MKPVIQKQNYHNLLLLRDDREVLSMRVGNAFLRFLIVAAVCLVVFGSIGIGVGYYFWQESNNLQDQHKKNEIELARARLQLEQLSNVKSLLTATNASVPLPKNEEVPVPAVLKTEAPFQHVNATTLATAEGKPAETNATIKLAQANTNATKPDSTEKNTRSIDSNNCPVRVNNFTSRATGQSTLRIRYELVVAEADTPVRGSARYAAIFANGTVQDIAPQSPDDSRFSINRMKNMESTARLTAGQAAKNVKAIRIIVELEGGESFQDDFALPSQE